MTTRIGSRYLYNSPDPRLERLNPVRRLWRRALATTFTEGDDLSHYNTVTNWFAKQTENKFSVLKIGEGNSPNPDSTLWESAANAKASGTFVMAYWFFRSNVTGEVQLANSLPILEQLANFLGYKPVIWADAETSDGVANSVRLGRLNVLTNGWKTWNPDKVGLYSSPGFANLYLTPVPAWLNDLWHWIAHWTSAALPTQPNGWNVARRKLWQYGVWNNYAWAKPAPGCNPDIDTNRFFGTEAELAAFCGAPPASTLEQRVAALEAIAHTH